MWDEVKIQQSFGPFIVLIINKLECVFCVFDSIIGLLGVLRLATRLIEPNLNSFGYQFDLTHISFA